MNFPPGVLGKSWVSMPPQSPSESRRQRRQMRRYVRRAKHLARKFRLRMRRHDRRLREQEILRSYMSGVKPPEMEGAPTFRLSRRTRKKVRLALERLIEIRRAEMASELNRLVNIRSAQRWRNRWQLASDQEDRKYERQRDDRLAELWPLKTPEERRQVAEWARRMPRRIAPERGTP